MEFVLPDQQHRNRYNGRLAECWNGVPVQLERRFDWEAGDVVYIPPNTISQHFNADPNTVTRIIVITNRIYKQSGLNDLQQYETAPEYNPDEVLTAELLERYLYAKA